jgi:hypothetical protein
MVGTLSSHEQKIKPMHRDDARVKDVRITDEELLVILTDGRKISTPLSWYPSLYSASQEVRNHWQSCAAGSGIHWPLIDQHLSIKGMLEGQRSPH